MNEHQEIVQRQLEGHIRMMNQLLEWVDEQSEDDTCPYCGGEVTKFNRDWHIEGNCDE